MSVLGGAVLHWWRTSLQATYAPGGKIFACLDGLDGNSSAGCGGGGKGDSGSAQCSLGAFGAAAVSLLFFCLLLVTSSARRGVAS